MQIKTTINHLTPAKMAIIKKKKNSQTINAVEGVGRSRPSCTAGGNVSQYSHCGDTMEGP